MNTNRVTVLGCWGLATVGETASFLVELGGYNILLDMNPGVTRELKRTGFDLTKLDIAFGSHVHADHLLGATYLIFQRSVEVRSANQADVKPFVVFGTKDVLNAIRATLEIHYPDRKFNYDIYEIKYSTEDEIISYNIGELKIQFAQNNHTSTTSAIRLDCSNRSICYTSDGIFTAGVSELAKNVDLLIGEAFGTASDYLNTYQNVKHSLGTHLGSFASESKARKLLPFHMHPMYDQIQKKKFELINEITKNYKGELIWPSDQLVLNI